jgi:hypothetical protein
MNMDLVNLYAEGIKIDSGDTLKIEYMSADGKSIEKEELAIIETIEHYNGDLFLLTFKDKQGSFSFSLNQLVHFKYYENINRFDVNKTYIFDKEIALKHDKHLKKNYESGNSKYWVDYCDGKQVTDTNEHGGFINGEVNMYTIDPTWCRSIDK